MALLVSYVATVVYRRLNFEGLPGGPSTPLDRASWELQPHAKTTVRRWLTIDHSRRLRKLAGQRRNQRFFAGPPEPLGHYPSTVGTDVLRERFFHVARFFRACDVHGDRHREALLNSPIKKPLRVTLLLRSAVHGCFALIR